jgi:hypothetical protein|tara:strand:+ start:390 stop:614 length:225 start_codon:yes stop_codon:yes gene_type:complete
MKLDTFLKWTATAVLIVGTGINAFGIYPLGAIILALGGLIWLAVSCMWREPSLIVTNGVLFLVGTGGIVLNYMV